MSDLLRVESLSAGYGAARVLEEVSFALPEAGRLAVLGRNGVGKSTLIRALMGAVSHQGGHVLWRGRDITALPSADRAALGIGWVPQERRIFRSLTVRENLEVAARPGAWTLQRIWQLLPRLAERQGNAGWQLSGGEQQLLAIGRALMLNPDLLLLDEPLEGLAPVMVEHVLQTLQELAERAGMALILVEQHAADALAMTQQAIVLDRGRVVHRDDSSALAADTALLERLVGVGLELS